MKSKAVTRRAGARVMDQTSRAFAWCPSVQSFERALHTPAWWISLTRTSVSGRTKNPRMPRRETVEDSIHGNVPYSFAIPPHASVQIARRNPRRASTTGVLS